MPPVHFKTGASETRASGTRQPGAAALTNSGNSLPEPRVRPIVIVAFRVRNQPPSLEQLAVQFVCVAVQVTLHASSLHLATQLV